MIQLITEDSHDFQKLDLSCMRHFVKQIKGIKIRTTLGADEGKYFNFSAINTTISSARCQDRIICHLLDIL